MSEGTRPFSILLVEDNDADAERVSEYINELGAGEFSVTRSRTLNEALEEMEGKEHDVVLLDLHLPDSLDGEETIHRICEHHDAASPLVVVLTGSDDAALASEAIRDCAQNYLLKNEIGRRPRRRRGTARRRRCRARSSGRYRRPRPASWRRKCPW